MSEKIIMICENHGVEYKSSITSNGYLIDDDFIKNMKKFKISTAHITLDGPPNFHNKTRKLKNGQGTFGVIIENIKKLINSGIKVFIRVNVTKFNMNCFEELLDVLDKNNLNNITITPSAVVSYKNTNTDITNTCLSAEEFSKKLLEYCKLMSTRKFSAANYPYSFSIKTNYCFADNISSYTIDYNGNIYKCWVDVGTPNCSLGNIRYFLERDLLTAAENDSKYIFWSAFKHKKCMECKVLPICMGGCPSRGIINNNKPYCELAKYCLEDALKTQLS